MAHFVQARVPLEKPKKSHLSCQARRNFPCLHIRRREGIRRKRNRERNWGERVGDACYENPFLFISAVRKFQIGWAVISNLLACILACIIMRDKHDAGIKQMCSSGISFGRSKLLQSCGNLTLKPELEPAVTACLAGRDAQEVLYTGFHLSIHRAAIQGDYDSCQTSAVPIFTRPLFPKKHYINTVMNELLMVCKERAEALVKTIRWAFWQLFIILLSLFGSQWAGRCFWWGKNKDFVYSHETDHCLP